MLKIYSWKQKKEWISNRRCFTQLLETEHRQRQSIFLYNRLKNAALPEEWTLDTFPFHQQTSINKIQIMNLAKLNFIERHENIVLSATRGQENQVWHYEFNTTSDIERLSLKFLMRRHCWMISTLHSLIIDLLD